MAMSVMYTTVNGVLLHENRGGVETEYTPDPLGNLIQCRDSAGTKTYEAWYWPYGEVRSETGTNPSPWGFVGLLGYLRDAATLLYVRARYYRPVLSRWQTVDPLWPQESAYGYVACQPSFTSDRSGQNPCWETRICPQDLGIVKLSGRSCIWTRECLTFCWTSQCGVPFLGMEVWQRVFIAAEDVASMKSVTKDGIIAACGLACLRLKDLRAIGACGIFCLALGLFLSERMDTCKKASGDVCFEQHQKCNWPPFAWRCCWK